MNLAIGDSVKYELKIEEKFPWTKLNEYEGHIQGIIDGLELCLYVMFCSIDDWNTYACEGSIKEVDVWLERTGDFELLDFAQLPHLQQMETIEYRVVGKVLEIAGENVLLDIDNFLLKVDLDVSTNVKSELNSVQIGQMISVIGILKVDFEPDEEQDCSFPTN